MTETVIKTKRGQAVGLHLPARRSDEVLREGNGLPTRKRFIGISDEEDRYVFRRRGELEFFDLGTRLRTVPTGFTYTGLELRDYGATDSPDVDDALQNEYVEVRYEVAASSLVGLEPDGAPAMSVTDHEFLQLRRMMLGSRAPSVDGEPDDPVDPLGFSTANGSSRKIPNCMPLYFGTIGDSFTLGSFAFHLFPIRINLVHLFDLFADGRAFVRESQSSDIDERWCPDNIHSGAAFSQVKFTKAYQRSLKGGHLRVEDIGSAGIASFYFSFDTQDTANVKITTEPDFSADAVIYKYRVGDRVYLRPRLGGAKRVAVISSVVRIIANWVTRRYPFTGTIIPAVDNVAPLPARNWVRRSLYSEYGAFPTATDSHHSYNAASDPTLQDELLDGDLIAIIAGIKKEYYLWRRRL